MTLSMFLSWAVLKLFVCRIIMTAVSTFATYHVTEDTSPQAAEAATCPPLCSAVPGLVLALVC